jgi:hypothetical protein
VAYRASDPTAFGQHGGRALSVSAAHRQVSYNISLNGSVGELVGELSDRTAPSLLAGSYLHADEHGRMRWRLARRNGPEGALGSSQWCPKDNNTPFICD